MSQTLSLMHVFSGITVPVKGVVPAPSMHRLYTHRKAGLGGRDHLQVKEKGASEENQAQSQIRGLEDTCGSKPS